MSIKDELDAFRKSADKDDLSEYKRKNNPIAKGEALYNNTGRAANETHDYLRKYKENALQQEQYENSLSAEDRNVYQRVKASNGAYVSPYLQQGTEGKEKLEYGNADWNALPEEERKKWLDIAYNRTDGVYAASDRWKHAYATSILKDSYDANYAAKNEKSVMDRLKDIALNTVVGKQIAKKAGGNLLESGEQTFDADRERAWEFYSLPADVQEYFTYGRLLNGKDDAEVKQYIADNYDEYNLKRLQEYGEQIKAAKQRQLEQERTENWLYRNPVNPTVGQVVRLGGDIFGGWIGGLQTKANYILSGDTDTNQTFFQKWANTANDIGSDITNTLQESGMGGWATTYEQSYSMAENMARMYLARLGGTSLGKLTSLFGAGVNAVNATSSIASNVLINQMVSNSVFNNMFTQSVQQGMAPGEAFTRSMAYAFFEGAFETISFDKLGYFDGKPVMGSWKDVAKQLLKGGFVEGMEEYNTELAQGLYDYFQSYDYSDYKAYKDKLEEQYGRKLTDKEAWSEYGWEFANRASKAFLGGALSGMVLGLSEGGAAYARGREYRTLGNQISDEEYSRLNSVAEDWAKMFPRVANELQQSTEAGEDVRRGYVKALADAMTERFETKIEEAKGQKQLMSVMENMNDGLNGAIPKSTIDKYNAKLAEMGRSNLMVDYDKFRQNVEKGRHSTFNDMAYGEGTSGVLNSLSKSRQETYDVLSNREMDDEQKSVELDKIFKTKERNKQIASDIVSKLALEGKEFNSPEVQKYVGDGALSLEEAAKAFSQGKYAVELEKNPVQYKAATISKMSPERALQVFGKTKAQFIKTAEYENTDNFKRAMWLGNIATKMGVNVEVYASTRNNIVPNGAYHNGTVFIDANAGADAQFAALGEVYSHELTHWMADRSGELFKKFTETVRNEMGHEVFDGLVEAELNREVEDENGNMVSAYSEEDKKSGKALKDATEEVIAQVCQEMIKDSRVFAKYAAADVKTAKSILQKFREFVKKLVDMFRSSLHNEATRAFKKNVENLQRIVDEWDAMLESTIAANKYVSEADSAEVQEALAGKGNIVDVVKRNDDGQMVLAVMEDGTLMYSERTYSDGGKREIIKALKAKGYSEEDIRKCTDGIEKHLRYIHELGELYATKSFTKLKENLGKDITLDLAYEGHLLDEIEKSGSVSQELIDSLRSQHQVAYAYVPNGDYAANIDFQLSCKKRIAYEMVINKLIDNGAMNDVRLSPELIGEINKTLAENEFETQCLGCFVEAKRQQMQKWAETICSEWNENVEKITGRKRENADPDKDYLFHGKNKANGVTAYQAMKYMQEQIDKGVESYSEATGGIKFRSSKPYERMAQMIRFNPKVYGYFLDVGDIMTSSGLMELRKLGDGNLFSIVISRYGANSIKILQDFNPYNSEVLKLTFESLEKMTGSAPAKANYVKQAEENLTKEERKKIRDIYFKNYTVADTKEQQEDDINRMIDERISIDAMRLYLYDVGGNRIQSFSDFMIENVFDYLQTMTDFAIREYPLHGYTKEQICLRLFGMTGAKWNGSWISHNVKELGNELSGLMPYTEENAKNGITVEVDGEKYVIQFDDYQRHTKEGSFIQSIGFKDAIAIMLDPRYSSNVGTITIGFSDKHIRAMLNSPYFRMIIPYHKSSIMAGFADFVGVSTYNDYSDYQETTLGKVRVYKDGKVVAEFNGKKSFEYNGKTYSISPNMGYNFNNTLQRVGDARVAAQEYVDWCRSEHEMDNKEAKKDGLVITAEYNPKFSNSPEGYDFTKEANYYKLIEDFNTYDSREEIINGTKVSAPQGAVQMLYPGDEGCTLSSEQLERYKNDLIQTGLFSEKEIDKYVKKAQMTFDELIGEEVAGRNAYNEKVLGKDNERLNKMVDHIMTDLLPKYKRADEQANAADEFIMSYDKGKKDASKSVQPPKGTYIAKTKDDKVYSYRGVNSNLTKADMKNLDLARSLEEEGKDSETIRLATGWFRGYDKKWRNEVDDSQAKLKSEFVPDQWSVYNDPASKARGYYEAMQMDSENLVNRMNNLARQGVLNNDERYQQLNKEWINLTKEIGEYRRFVDRATRGEFYLSDVLDHPRLYKAYPKLKNLRVKFETRNNINAGGLNYMNGTIAVAIDNVSNIEIMKTIMHEVQHEIQRIEGFANGANPNFWRRQIKDASSPEIDKAKEKVTELEKKLKETEWHGVGGGIVFDPATTASMYLHYSHELENAREKGNKDDIEDYEYRLWRYEQIARENGYLDLMREYVDSSNELARLREELYAENKKKYDPYNMYRNTAGEIEAYDTEDRIALDKKHRKKVRPDIDRENVYFAEEGLKLSRRDSDIPVDKTHPDVDFAMSVEDTDANFLEKILSGEKTVETRDNLAAYNMFKGKRVALLDRAKNQIVGYATVSPDLIEYNTYDEFRKDYDRHKVPPKSKYDMKQGEKKYGIKLENVERLDTPVEAKGRNFALGQTMYYTPSETSMKDSAGNTLSEQQAEYFKDSVIRDEDGNLLVVYNGTPNKTKTRFGYERIGGNGGANHGYGFYFSPKKSEAAMYAQGVGQVIPTYLNIKNPINATDKVSDEFFDKFVRYLPMYARYALEETFGSIEGFKDYYNGDTYETLLVSIPKRTEITPENLNRSILMNMGYDGIVYDDGEYTPEYVAFDSSQIKRIDNKNPSRNPDIRYSIRNGVASYTDERIDQLLEEYGDPSGFGPNYSKAYMTYISPDDFLKLTTNDLWAIENESRELNEEELRNNRLWIELSFDEEDGKYYICGHEGRHRMVALRNAGVEKVAIVIKDTRHDGDTEHNKYNRKTEESMTFSKQSFNSANWYDFDHDTEPKVTLTNLVPVSYGNEELLKETFTNPDDQIHYSYRDRANDESQILINALSSEDAVTDAITRQSIEAYAREYGKLKEMEEEVSKISKDLRKKGVTPSEKEVGLKRITRLQRAIINKTTELTEMRNQRVLRDLLIHEWERRDELVQAGVASAIRMTKEALKEKYGDEIAALKEKSKAQKKAIRDRAEINRHKKNIMKKTNDLMNMILHPNEKHKVPTILINPVKEMLEAIDYWTPRTKMDGTPSKTTKKSESLFRKFYNFKTAVESMQDKVDEGADVIYDMFDPDFLEYVDQLAKFVSESDIDNVNDMGLEQIKILDKVLDEIRQVIKIGNDMITSAHYQTVNQFRDVTKETLNQRKDLKEYKDNRRGGLWKRYNAGVLDGYGLARMAGAGTKEIIDMMSDAYFRKINLMREATEFTQSVLAGMDIQRWKDEEHEFTLDSGKTIKMNIREMVDLYLLSKREQAYNHIVSDTEAEALEKQGEESDEPTKRGGGIHIRDRKGRYTEIKKISKNDLETILDTLREVAPEAIEVGEKLQEFGATTVTGWGNKASNLLYGINKFTEPDYWPIRSSEAAMKQENSDKKMMIDPNRLKNMGRAKNITPGANNAIYVEDFLDVWSDTIDDMTSYAEMLPAVTDANRWWNSRVEEGTNKRVKDLFAQKLGSDMANNFRDLITALNGGVKGQDSLSNFAKALMGKSKAAAVAFNPRVVFQQFTAYPRALAVIEEKYLAKALTMKPSMQEAQDHSAIAWLKHQGFYSNGLAPSVKKLITGDATFNEKITEKTMYFAGLADDITWGYLWNAARLKVEDTTDLKEGTEEYWKAIDRIFSDIINNTQVVDTPFTKSPWMRSNGFASMYMAFMAEPLKTTGMVLTAVDNFMQDHKDGAKVLGVAATAWLLQSVANAMAQSFADAARDDDKEKDYWEKWLEKFFINTKDNLNPLTYIPLVKDAWSSIKGFTNKSLVMQGMDNLIAAGKEIYKAVNGDSKYTLFGTAELVAKAYSYLTGVPVSNAMRTLNSMGNVLGTDLFRRKEYTKAELGRNVVLEIRDGNTDKADKYYQELVKRCDGDESKAKTELSTYLSKHDDDVDRMAVSFAEDAMTLDDSIAELVLKYASQYIDDDVANKAIRKAAQQDLKDAGSEEKISTSSVADTIYNSSDINRALEAGKIQEAQKIIDAVNEGYKKKESKDTAKDLVSNYWKEKYLAATGAERDKIAKMLYKLRNNGKQMFSSSDLKRWVEDAKKKK